MFEYSFWSLRPVLQESELKLKTSPILSHISFHDEVSRDFVVSINYFCSVRKFWSQEFGVHKPELSRNLILCHVTCISTNQNAPNFYNV